jgi:hypothetical protein
MRLARGKEVIQIAMLKKLLLTLVQQLCCKLGPILFTLELTEYIQEIHEVIQGLDPSDNFPVGIGLRLEAGVETIKEAGWKPEFSGQISVVGMHFSAQVDKQPPHREAKFIP